MALQTCKRCRKRRIRCDLNLPGCENCRLADAECFFFDVSIQQEVPRSYCYSLQKRAEEIEIEIRNLKDTAAVADVQVLPENTLPGMLDYHLDASRLRTDPDHAHTMYLGPGSSARLIQHLLKSAVEWHLTHKSPEFEVTVKPLLSSFSSLDALRPSKTLVILDYKMIELSSIVTPSTQRALVEHYFNVVQAEYPLLSPDQEIFFLEKENPLRWCAANPSHTDSMPFIAVLAISSALFARDFDSKLTTISVACKEYFRVSSTLDDTRQTIQTRHRSIMKGCFSTICEMVAPTAEGVTWYILGRALASMAELRDEYRAQLIAQDPEFHRLEYCLLKLDESLALHFRRPSMHCRVWSGTNFTNLSTPHRTVESVVLYNRIRYITETLCISPLPPQERFESLIPSNLQISAGSAKSIISTQSAEVYIALHPLFTSRGLEIFSDYPLQQAAMNLLHIIGNSACTIIGGYAQRWKQSKIISIWMAAERVLEAGAVWATYLMIMRRKQTSSGGLSSIGMKAVMKTLTSCSALLVGFAERWKEGAVYVEIWEIFLSLLWGILE